MILKNILIFAGTTEGRRVSEILTENRIKHTVCVATEYGELLLDKNEFAFIHCGRMDEEKMRSFITEGDYKIIVDATHPYAFEVTENIKSAVSKINEEKNSEIKYLRLKRDMGIKTRDEMIRYFDSNEECAASLKDVKGNILLTTGSKELNVYASDAGLKDRLFARIIPGEESIKICNSLGISGKNIIAMQGPFPVEMNEAMIDMYDISVMVTKQSGIAGGFPEKVKAAQNKNILLFVIGCETKEEGFSTKDTLKEISVLTDTDIVIPETGSAITLMGIGMGDVSLLTKEAKESIDNADVLMGAERLLNSFKESRAKKYPYYLSKDIIPALKELKAENEHLKAAILFSGDSSFYSGASSLYEALKKEGLSADILPGISSVSYLSSKIGVAYSDALILSIHGREIKNIARKISTSAKTFVLVSNGNDIAVLGEKLEKTGINDIKITVGSNLSYPDEKIEALTLNDAKAFAGEGIFTVFIDNPNALKTRSTHGLNDAEFLRNKTPMTKEEVREVSICKLRLNNDSVFWDIGSGTGSIAVESALLSDEISVFAIEKKDEACDLIESNKDKFDLENISVIRGIAPEALNDLPLATHAFVGGSSGNLKEILEKLVSVNPSMRVVINAITIETMCEMKKIPDLFNVKDFEIIQMQVSRSDTAGDYHLMKAENPVWICSFDFAG